MRTSELARLKTESETEEGVWGSSGSRVGLLSYAKPGADPAAKLILRKKKKDCFAV